MTVIRVARLEGFSRQHEGRQSRQPVDRKERQFGGARRGQDAVGERAVLLQAAPGLGRAARGEPNGGGEGKDEAEIVGAAHDLQAGVAHRRLDLAQPIAPLVLEEDVVAAPQEAEGGHRRQEMRAGRHLGGVVADEAAIVVDVLQHVHHQHEVAVGRPGVAPVEHRLAAFAVVAIARHSRCRRTAPIARRPRPADGGRRNPSPRRHRGCAGAEAADHAPERGRLRPVVPVPADVGA